MSWQDRMVAVYQNYLHPGDTSVDLGISSTQAGQGFELANTMNLIPSSIGRFASGADQRGNTSRKIIRYVLPKALSVNCIALINVHSFTAENASTGAFARERLYSMELFHGNGTSPYGQDGGGTGSPGTTIISSQTPNVANTERYGANFFYSFNAVTAQVFTLRFSLVSGAIGQLGVGNVLLGRSFDFPTSPQGWFLLAPTRKRLEQNKLRAGRPFGAIQVETRYKSRRRWSIPSVWFDETERELFESYLADRTLPRMDGVQNQHLKERLDLPTAVVMPWQWTGSPAVAAHPTFGTFGDEIDVDYDELGNSITRVDFAEIA